MFSFFKKKPASHGATDLSALHTDMHSHLVPGIDDGSPDVTVSQELIKGLLDLGFKKLVTTPHVMWDMYQNTDEIIDTALGTLQQELDKNRPGFTVRSAAEYLLDDHFEMMLAAKQPLRTISGNMVLVECSFISAPFNLNEQLFNLQMNGYQPILAHPERYLYYKSRRDVYDDLKSAGCLLQVNLLSLIGYYGKQQQELAHYLVGKKYVDLLGTDMHHERHLQAMRHAGGLNDTIKQLMDSGKILNPGL